MDFNRQPLAEMCNNSPELCRGDKLSRRERTRLMYKDFQLTDDQLDLLTGIQDFECEEYSHDKILEKRTPPRVIYEVRESVLEEERVPAPPKRRRKRLSADQSLVCCGGDNIILTPPNIEVEEERHSRRSRRRNSLAIYRDRLKTERTTTTRRRKSVLKIAEIEEPAKSQDHTHSFSAIEAKYNQSPSLTLVNPITQSIIQSEDKAYCFSQSNRMVRDDQCIIDTNVNTERGTSCAYLLEPLQDELEVLPILDNADNSSVANQSESIIETSQSNLTLLDMDTPDISSEVVLIYTSKVFSPIYPKPYSIIYEEPIVNRGNEMNFSKVGKKRFYDFSEGYYYHPPPSKVSSRRKKAKINGWRRKTSKERQALEETFRAKMERLNLESDTDEN